MPRGDSQGLCGEGFGACMTTRRGKDVRWVARRDELLPAAETVRGVRTSNGGRTSNKVHQGRRERSRAATR